MTKKHYVKPHEQVSQNPQYSDPSAFYQHWPRIELLAEAAPNALGVGESVYKMGVLRIKLSTPEQTGSGYFISFHGKNQYPEWDAMVWVKYNLTPDAARMGMILPNLDSYINIQGSSYQYVFTMEQLGWVFNPTPEHCGIPMTLLTMDKHIAHFTCPKCSEFLPVDGRTWNEDHGHGFLAPRPEFKIEYPQKGKDG